MRRQTRAACPPWKTCKGLPLFPISVRCLECTSSERKRSLAQKHESDSGALKCKRINSINWTRNVFSASCSNQCFRLAAKPANHAKRLDTMSRSKRYHGSNVILEGYTMIPTQHYCSNKSSCTSLNVLKNNLKWKI
jgi:hypothetical protein